MEEDEIMKKQTVCINKNAYKKPEMRTLSNQELKAYVRAAATSGCEVFLSR